MFKKAVLFGLGVVVGLEATLNLDDLLYNDIHFFLGTKNRYEGDYLKVSTNLSLDERRIEFARNLQERGRSFKVLELIGDVNREIFETRVIGKNAYDTEMQIFENAFRKYYPELFDETSGRQFIESLNLKTKGNDNEIPLLQRPR